MSDARIAGESRPWIALGLAFLLIGLGYATPIPLVHTYPAGIWEGRIPAEVLNLYALTAFLGWGHFLYAWQGQSRATRRLHPSRQVLYWAAVLLTLAALISIRHALGVGVFSLIVWVYNIGHFVKAESYFSGQAGRGKYFTPVVALPGSRSCSSAQVFCAASRSFSASRQHWPWERCLPESGRH